jgi:hypothetical protein
MTEKEKLFVNTVLELEERFTKKTEYDLLKASGLIRQLLVDQNTLVDQVNKNYKLKIKFKVRKRFKFNNSDSNETKWNSLSTMMLFISPDKSSDFVELLSKDEFFKYQLLSHHETSFTVLDVIKICANKYGGVHIEDIEKGKSLELDRMSKLITFNGTKSVFYAIYGIIEVCLKALTPLKNTIIDND